MNDILIKVGIVIFSVLFFHPESANAQVQVIQHAVKFDVSIPFRDMKPVIKDSSEKKPEKRHHRRAEKSACQDKGRRQEPEEPGTPLPGSYQ